MNYQEFMNIQEVIFKQIGNGDIVRGGSVMGKIVAVIEYARDKHPQKEWQEMSVIDAFNALQEELNEVKFAIDNESKERMHDELLDVIAVAVRMLNEEYKK